LKTFEIWEYGENLQSNSQKSEKIWFRRQEPGWSDIIHARGQNYPGEEPKGQTKFWGQQMLFGTKFMKFGTKKASLATLTVILESDHLPTTWQESELMFRNNGLLRHNVIIAADLLS